MKILVCGGRIFRNENFLYSYLDQINKETPVSLVICGAQRKWMNGKFIGTDWFAIEWAQSREIPFVGVPARWNQYGDSAGPIRNAVMLDDWKPDRVLAFPGNQGTRNMIALALVAGIPVTTVGW